MRSKFFFLYLTLRNAGFVACAFFVITSLYKIHLIYSDSGLFSHNLEAMLEPFRMIVNPVVTALGLPTSQMPEGKMSGELVVLINALWMAVPTFIISFVIFGVPFLLIDLIARQKARIPYYLPCFAFIIYAVFFFVMGAVIALDAASILSILLVLAMICLIFITNRYAIHPLQIHY